MRVSTNQQDVENQRHGILEYANQKSLGQLKFVSDSVSGQKRWRERELGKLLTKTAGSADTIVFAEISRMARSTLQVLEILECCMQRGLSVHIAKQRMVLDDSMPSRITATVLGLAAEIERELISMRTTEALAKRKAAGKTLGRPKGKQSASLKLDAKEQEIRMYLAKGISKRSIAKLGKVERPFRTVKEMHETLYHLHEPETITEANTWLMQFLLHYNKQSHRRESHSRIEDWLDNLSREGIREMCSWERFCTFAREPEQRKVGIDARVTVDGVAYEVEPDLAGEKVILWWGLFDSELYVEYQETRHGPYAPIGKPIPLDSYRSFKKTNTQQRSDRIEALAKQLALPDSATGAVKLAVIKDNLIPFPVQSFVDPDPFEELEFKNAIAAKVAIADYLFLPLAKLTPEQMAAVEEILSKTLNKKEVMGEIKDYFSR